MQGCWEIMKSVWLNWFARARRSDRALLERWCRDCRGASALEFALVSPVLIFLIVGIVQTGLVLHRGSTLQWAAEHALRTAMLDAEISPQTLHGLIGQRLQEMGDDGEFVIEWTVTETAEAYSIGNLAVTYDYPVVLPMMDIFHARFTVETSVPLPPD